MIIDSKSITLDPTYRKINKWRLEVFFTEEETANIGKRVVWTDQQNWQNEPNYSVKNILHAHVTKDEIIN